MPNARIDMTHLYVQFLPIVRVFRSLFYYPFACRQKKSMCVPGSLQDFLSDRWEIQTLYGSFTSCSAIMICLFYTYAASHSQCMLTLLPLCVHVYVRMCEHAQIMCHIFPGECLIPVTASSSSVRKWQLSLTRIPLTSLFMLAHSVTALFHFSPPLLH